VNGKACQASRLYQRKADKNVGGGSVSGEAKSGGGGISICLDLRTWREEQRQLFVGVVGERWCGQMWEDVVICKAALGGLER
jgi:hypothetical protein